MADLIEIAGGPKGRLRIEPKDLPKWESFGYHVVGDEPTDDQLEEEEDDEE